MATQIQGRTVFISLAHDDLAKGASLMKALQQRDTESWCYKEPYIGSFHDKIAEEIRNCDVLIVLISKAALCSKWVKQEVTLAMELQRAIVPVELEPLQESDFHGTWSFLRASQNFLKLHADDQAGIDDLADCITRQLNPDLLISQPAARTSPPVTKSKPRPWRLRLPRAKSLAAAAAGVALFGAGFSYCWVIPARASTSLSGLSQAQNYSACYEQAKDWQKSPLLGDKSIPSYWRVMAFQSMYADDCFQRRDPRRIDDLDQEYRKAIARAGMGSQAAALLYQYGQFKRRIHDDAAASEILVVVQAQYPDSPWKEGTAYYLAQLALAQGDLTEADRQIQKLASMPGSAQIFDLDAARYMSLGDGLAALRQQMTAAQENSLAAE